MAMTAANSITFTGTSAAPVSGRRHHSSLLLTCTGYSLLVDCGDGTSKALYEQNENFRSIDGILFSHFHADHASGFPSLITQMKLVNRTEPLAVYAWHKDIELAKDLLFNAYLFEERMDFEIDWMPFRHDTNVLVAEDFSFIARPNTHLDEYREYDPSGKLSFVSNSFLFRMNNKTVYYSGDIGGAADLSLFENYGVDIVISETTHTSFEEVLEAAMRMNPAGTYLTHLSDEQRTALPARLKQVESPLVNRIFPADDGLLIEL